MPRLRTTSREFNRCAGTAQRTVPRPLQGIFRLLIDRCADEALRTVGLHWPHMKAG